MHRFYVRQFLILTFIGLSQQLLAQRKVDSSSSIPFIRFEYAYFLPGGDFEERFGNAHMVGGALEYKTKSNWQFGFQGGLIFGSDVKVKGLLDKVINQVGDVTDADGELIKLNYELTGYNWSFLAGRVFNLGGRNQNSGILVQAGIGYLQHQIKIDYRDGSVYQLEGENIKGYDRLTAGISLKQFVGYQYFGSKNLLNFYAGFEVNEAFTKNLREYNYDTQSFDKGLKKDYLYGFRFGWIIPFRKRASEDFYYY